MNETTNYKGHLVLQARVIAAKADEITVILPDRKKAYIPRKEWTWERSIRKPIKKFREGDTVQVVVVPKTDSIEFSIRELEDPWKEIDQFSVGQIQIGEVVDIRESAVYVELSPGIDGKIPIQNIPLQVGIELGTFLGIGDKVKVEVTKVDSTVRLLELNLITPLQVPFSKDALATELQGFFHSSLQQLQDNVASMFSTQSPLFTQEIFLTSPITHFENVLVIDNEINDGEGVSRLLETHLNVKTHWVKSQNEALSAVKDDIPSFDLAVIDVNLSDGENGVEVAKKMLRIKPDLPCLFMSKDTLSEADLLSIETEYKRPFPFALKRWGLKPNIETANELFNRIQLLREGKIIKNTHYSALQEGRFLGGLEQTNAQNLSLSEKLAQLLKELATETRIEHALILQLDKEKKEVEIAAAYPPKYADAYKRGLDGIYHSPVKNVIEEGQIFYLSKIDIESRSSGLKNFFPELSFQSCYGISIKLSGQLSEYGLFVLDQRPDFIWSIISRIRLCASFAGLTIEKHLALNQLRPLQDFILRGELMSTFLHELNNKLAPLMDLIEEGLIFMNENKKHEFWEFFQDTAPDLLKIKQLANAYGRLAKQDMEEVDLNSIVEKVQHQLRPYAQRVGVQLAIHTKELPLVHAISLQVEQVLTNVVLNAIQHIDEQNQSRRNFNDSLKAGSSQHLQEHRLVLINTCASPKQDACYIVVVDSGPGVPYYRREKIFQLGESSRAGGHGLGLYISRSLMEAMHGRLVWVDSVQLWGSAFAIIFPLNKRNEP